MSITLLLLMVDLGGRSFHLWASVKGDSLPPFLFIIVANCLSHLLAHSDVLGNIVTHLFGSPWLIGLL